MCKAKVLKFDAEFEPEMGWLTPIPEIKAEIIRRGWTNFEISFDIDNDKLIVRRLSKRHFS